MKDVQFLTESSVKIKNYKKKTKAQGAHNTGATAADRAGGSSRKAPPPPNKTTRPTRAAAATKNNFDGVKGKRIFKK